MTHTERESRQMTKCLLQRLAWLNRTGQTYDITNEQYSVYPRAICDTTGNPNKGTKAKWTDKLSKHWRKNQGGWGGGGGGSCPLVKNIGGGRAPLHLAMILRTLKLDLHALYCHVHVKHPICSQNALKLTQRDMKNQNFTGGACLQIPLDHGELNPLVNHHSASCFQPPYNKPSSYTTGKRYSSNPPVVLLPEPPAALPVLLSGPPQLAILSLSKLSTHKTLLCQ